MSSSGTITFSSPTSPASSSISSQILEDEKDQEKKPPFYKNPNFLSVIVAFIAILLSQLPPVLDMTKGERIELILFERIKLFHFFGNTQLTIPIEIHNIGGWPVNIARMQIYILGPENLRLDLPGSAYFEKSMPNPGQRSMKLPLGWISLKPDESWMEMVSAMKPFNQKKEEKMIDLVSKVREDLMDKIGALNNQFGLGARQRVEIAPELDRQVKEFVHSNLKLIEGKYRLLVALISEKNKLIRVRGRTFSLYPSQIKRFKKMTENYKYGDDILGAGANLDLAPWIKTQNMDDELAKHEYLKMNLDL